MTRPAQALGRPAIAESREVSCTAPLGSKPKFASCRATTDSL
ncbi:MAG: hypothetical protein AAFR44_07820 [Pseudomonadota bacterium]